MKHNTPLTRSESDALPKGTPLVSCRADLWLWHARFFKTRALAGDAIDAAYIRVWRNGVMSRLIKRGAPLKANDRIVFAIGLRIIDVTITAIGTHRGSAEVAQTLYKRND